MYRLPPPNWDIPPTYLNGYCAYQYQYGQYGQYGKYVDPHFVPRGPSTSFMPGFNVNYQPRNQTPFYGGYNYVNNQRFFHQEQHYKSSDSIESYRNYSDGSTGKLVQEFSCDVCEKQFYTKKLLNGHLASHVKCEQEGCSFQACNKVVKLHFIQNHAEGRMRIVLETPEQIEKWREERRRNFPTVANIKKKASEEKERREKGQVAQNRTHRYRGKNQRIQNQQGRGPNWHQNQRRYPHKNKNQHSKNQEKDRQDRCQSGMENEILDKDKSQDQDPLSLVLLSGDEVQCDNNEQTSVVQKTDFITDPNPVNSSALMSLCASYGDVSSDEDNILDEINSSEINNNDKDDKLSIIKCVKENMNTNSSKSSPTRRKRRQAQKLKKGMIKKTKTKPTLLEKLLAPEIRHESNIILQCIRYIVKNNFFDAAPQGNDVLSSP